MSKEHSIALANALRKTKPVGVLNDSAIQWRKDIDAIAKFCKTQDRQFNRQRWLDYIHGRCGPSGGVVKEAKSLEVSHG